MAKAWDIAGYTYRAAVYCPEHIVENLPTGDGEDFDGWEVCVQMRVEDNLNEIAYAFGIDRDDERTFDSNYFPKVIFESDTVEDDICETCGRSIG